jgi:hypothetical protein
MQILKIDIAAATGLPAGPCCETCGAVTRLVGTEDHPRMRGLIVKTYECAACDSVVAVVSPPPVKSINAIVLVETPPAGSAP